MSKYTVWLLLFLIVSTIDLGSQLLVNMPPDCVEYSRPKQNKSERKASVYRITCTEDTCIISTNNKLLIYLN